MSERLAMLRRLMNERNISAYIVCTDDFHGSEYVGGYFKLREYLSGFTGSAGTLVVMPDTAALWTDGRYFIQAEQELSGSGIELMKMREQGTPSIAEFLEKALPDNAVIGFDGRAVSASFAENLLKKLADKKITAKTDEDMGGMVWEKLDKRPGLSSEPVFELPESVCGFSAAEKIEKIREKIKKEHIDCLVISALDQIAWTLNLRGNDVEYNPVFLSYMIISQDEVLLFANREIFPQNIVEKLEKTGVKILGYFDIYNEEIWLYKRVWLDSGSVNFNLKNTVKKHCEIIDKKSPVLMMKAVKNPAETEAIKAAHLQDGIAVTRFMYWLKRSAGQERITEISAAEKLEEFRKMSAEYLGQSFAPIMAYGKHGAIVHYSANEETDAELQPRGMLLSDTGGHYLGENAAGTTDITRTFVLGELTAEEKSAYTIVLAAHLELLNSKFPRGTRGSTIDYAAREVLWKNGMDFNHGTGHGVGFLLNVHEGPQTISKNAVNDPPIEPGMIVSCEPGYYVEGRFGIRHESLMLCVEDEEHKGFLRFEPLTMVPFDKLGIDTELLTDKQIEYLNNYHAIVYENLSKLVGSFDTEWLKNAAEPVKRTETPADVVIDSDGTLVKVPENIEEFYTVPDGVTAIGNEVFLRRGVIRVTLPDSIRRIGEYAFCDCLMLREINLENVRTIDFAAFNGCDSLGTVSLGSSLEEISDFAFSHTCIKEIIIPSSVKSINTNIFPYNISSVVLYDSTDITVQFDVLSEDNIDRFHECTVTMRSAESGKIKFIVFIPSEESVASFNCFVDGKFSFEKYDKLIAENFGSLTEVLDIPSDDTVHVNIITDRLKYPYKLTDTARKNYFAVLAEYRNELWDHVFENRDTGLLEILGNGQIITRENIIDLINRSVKAKITEFTAFLLNYKNERFSDLIDDLDSE